MTERNLGDSQTFQNLKQHTSKQYKEEITGEIRKYSELNTNINKTHQNLQDPANAVLQEKIMALNAYIRQEERLQINNLSFHHS